MNKETMKILLDRLTVVREKYEAKRQSDDCFNIFRVLHKSNDERRLHSRFLSVLLSPYATHNKKNIFLKLFLKRIEHNITLSDLEVYPNEYDKTEQNDIDIFIHNPISKEAIIIENKIGAKDSNTEKGGQLERYYNLVHKKYKIPKEKILVLYLAIDGRVPSKKSLGDLSSNVRKHYRCIYYEDIIIPWIDECVQQSATAPNLRESLIQYLKLVKDMTNHTEIDERLAIRELIAKNQDTMQSAKLLIENFKHIKWHTEKDFWDELEDILISRGYEITGRPSDSNITFNTHYEEYKKGYKANCYGLSFCANNDLSMSINTEYDYYLYWQCNDIKKSAYRKNILDIVNIVDNNVELDSTKTLAWKTFDFEGTKEIWLQDFTYEGTYNLIDPRFRKNAIEKLVAEIDCYVRMITSK